MRIALFIILTTIFTVIIDGPSYWWLASAFVLMIYILDLIEDAARRSVKD